METSRIINLVIAVAAATQIVIAQNVLDGAFIKENTRTQRTTPYPQLREGDVMWMKRVWRVIDLREKINQPLYFPVEPINDRSSLFDVIRKGVEDGSLTAYDVGVLGQDDEFRRPLLEVEVNALLTSTVSVKTEDSLGDPIWVDVPDPVTSSDVKMYKLKEDWIFDKQRGTMDIRIIGIAPMKEVKGDDGEVRGYAPLFWLYFPELRYLLKNHEVFNRNNDGERRSLDDLFSQRRFGSYITKESNSYDRAIADHKQGVDALLEGAAIQDRLFTFEHDLWNY